MISTTLVALAAASVASFVGAQDVTGTFPPVPLASKHYNSPEELVRLSFPFSLLSFA